MTCDKCGNTLIAADWSMPVDAKSEIESKVVKEFFSSLLVVVNCQLGGLAEFERELFTGLGWMAS